MSAFVSDSDAGSTANGNWSDHASNDPNDWIENGNTYTVKTEAGLAYFASLVNGGNTFEGKTVVLEKSPDLSGYDWTPIGIYTDADTKPFSGIFDGQEHKISNMKITASSENTGSSSGLFGYVLGNKTTNSEATYGIVKNLGLENTNIDSEKTYVGGIVGYNMNGVVQNCYNAGNAEGIVTDAVTQAFVGGIVGYNNGTIQNCYNTGNITGTGTYVFVGGIAGADGIIQNCYNTGNINGTSTGIQSFVGGIVGGIERGMIQNCYNAGNVEGIVISAVNQALVGGIVGYNSGTIQNCYNIGDVKGTGTDIVYVGGIVGYNIVMIRNCYNAGNVEGIGTGVGTQAFVGSIVGHVTGTAQNCYWLSGFTGKCIGNTDTPETCKEFSYGSGGDCVLNGGGSLKDTLNGFTISGETAYPAGWLSWKTDNSLHSPYLMDIIIPGDDTEDPNVTDVTDDRLPIKHVVKFSNGIGTQVLSEGNVIYNTTVTDSMKFMIHVMDGYSLLSVHASSGSLKQLGNGSYSLSDVSSDVTVYSVTENIFVEDEDNGNIRASILIAIVASAAISLFAMALLTHTRR